jgi:endogenous inhibitor of DNA gyrase (YacG/DUF329 family)
MTEKCIMCSQPATWIRSTQFAGDHPFCEEHARQEKDFGENDSYTRIGMNSTVRRQNEIL